MDIQFDVLWRHGGSDDVVVSFTHHFDAGSIDAVAFDGDMQGAAVAAHSGDQLVLRLTANAAQTGPAFIPNADGSHAHGRIPSLTLP